MRAASRLQPADGGDCIQTCYSIILYEVEHFDHIFRLHVYTPPCQVACGVTGEIFSKKGESEIGTHTHADRLHYTAVRRTF